MMNQQELIPHLFRTEFTKITAVLCKLFGIEHMQLAEDIAGETFLSALETWSFKGIPQNPVAWLYTVAKNKAKNALSRSDLFNNKIQQQIKKETKNTEEIEIDFSDQHITDSQLQMMFAICNPLIPVEAQIGLSLRILCGFGIEEIANAFLTNKETINKRLQRAKEKLRDEKAEMKLPALPELNKRLETVLTTLYLLFNEGYYSESEETVLREDLCLDAIRLCYLLVENELTNKPEVNALLSLMCFHASRFPARKNEQGELILYEDQDENLWDKALIEKGMFYINQAAQGTVVTKYHLEASIAYWHTIKADSQEKWESILQLYNRLLQIEYSPVVALNRTFALAKANGKEEAIKEAEKLQLTSNHYYYTLLGELYKDIDNTKALINFEKAFAFAKTKTDKQTISRKIDDIKRLNLQAT